MTVEIRPFGELFAEGTRNGLTRPKALRGAGIKMVNMGELFAHPRLRNADMDRVPLSNSEAQKFLLNEGDLLFARQSLVLEGAGKCSVFLSDDEPVTFESHVTRVRLDQKKAAPLFYFYYFQSHHGKSAIRSIVEQGAGASGIRGSDLQSLGVLWMAPPEQRAIAHILGTLDDKIELNRRRNQTLEAMARALFKDWFVDFGPVRAKMEGRDDQDGLVSGQRHGGRASGLTDPYLPADLWQLFPDRLDDDGKPEGWEVVALGDVAIELRRGISPSYLDSGGVRVLNQKCIRNREINFCLARRHDHSKRKIEGRAVMAGDILVNSTGVGTLGRTAQLWRIDEPTVIDSHVSVVRPNTDIVSICYLGLNLTGREAEIEMLGEGSTGQTELSRARLGCLQVLVPPRQILDQFDAKARPLLDAIFANTEEGTTLAQLRDTLLPKLISGDLRIADAEYFLNKIEDLSA